MSEPLNKIAAEPEKQRRSLHCAAKPVIIGESVVVKKKQIKCVCEERVRAFMRMLRIGEGTDTETGYTTAFGKNKITDLNKHPEKDYGGSTAAGAYQIMRYVYWWLNGEKLTDKYKKAGIYEESHDYMKKYNITDFRQESQDKLCIIIMKHKRPGLLDLIKKGEIEKAIRSIASLEWANLPHEGDIQLLQI
ncbi:MAG: glycoside hydrolase family 104 protein [Tannerella sp.]|jgi:muramidase (phage lysozyme)|nr:glycoside hydrolase family 104 protein [Tannerella sp.]